MKRALFVLVILSFLILPAGSAVGQFPIVSVNVATLNVREGPGLSYAIIGRVYRGEFLEVLNSNSTGTWLYICCTHTFDEGWVYAPLTRAWPPPTPVPAPPAPCRCTGNLYNCSSFATQGSAQACYNYCLRITGYDIHWLDADGDGLACEWNPR